MKFDFPAFEAALYAELHAGLARFAKSHRTQTFYAVALYGVYRELDGRLTLPALAASTEEDGPPRENPSTFWGARFGPPDWPFPEIPLRKQPAIRLERALTAEATRSTEAHWRATETKYFAILVRIARRLRDEARELLRVTEDFVCFWHDEEGGPELAGRSIPRRQLEKLFALELANRRELARVTSEPPDKRAAYLVTRFGSVDGVSREDAERELLAMGPGAVDALVSVVPDLEHGWQAAKLLGEIGISNAAVLSALRARVDQHWCTAALGMLGDHAWLAQQTPEVAVDGLVAPLRAGGLRGRLDYRPLEAHLDGEPRARKLAEQALAPGRSYAAIAVSDVDEAMRGLASGHDVVRWHAAAVLGERSLGAAAGKRILPALAAVLGDRNALVRRLAVLSLSYWKAAARPHFAAMRALRRDPDPVVRSVAAQTPVT